MFKSDYTIYGKHATYIKYLIYDVKAFKRYIDVYMAGAILGVLNNKRSERIDSADRARIYADAFDTEYIKCNEIFKTVILSETSKPWSTDDRINICFRYRDRKDDFATPPISDKEIGIMKEAQILFNSYVLGGIEILYENFSSSSIININETVDYAFKMIFDQNMLIESGDNTNELDDLLIPEY